MRMDTVTPPNASHTDWRRHLNTKTLVRVAVVFVVAYIIIWGLLSLLGQTLGVNQGTSFEPTRSPAMDAERSIGYGTYEKAPSAPPAVSGGTGSYDESVYETREYTAIIKTHDYDRTCGIIESWKPETFVIFEAASRGENRCYYRFKAEQDRAAAVLSELQALDPSDLEEQTRVVKRQLTEYTSELEILEHRELLLRQTLEGVTQAYDELTELSKQAQDVETLAKVIDGKLQYIERLSRERRTAAAHHS